MPVAVSVSGKNVSGKCTTLVALAVRLEKRVSELLRHGHDRYGGMDENNKRDETDVFIVGFVPLFYDPTFARKRRQPDRRACAHRLPPAWENVF